MREIFRREKPLEFRGEYYRIPYAGGDATGLGKPLKSILHGRASLPIYLAAVGPKNVALAAEIADGWIPVFYSPRRAPLFREWLDAGFKAAGRSANGFDVMPMVPVVVGADVAACRALVKPRVALYVGGMGARGRNFYNDIARRYGYEDAAKTIQDFYLSGKKAEAEAAVPDALVDEVALCGPTERIRDRVAEYKGAGVTTLMVAGDAAAVRTVAEAAL